MADYSYCLVDLPQHVVADCDIKMSGIDGGGIALFGHGVTDWSNATQVQAAIAAGKFYVFGGCNKNITIEFPDGSPVEVPNLSACGPENRTIGHNYQVNVQDGNVSANNDDFYGGLPLVQGATLVLHYCDDDTIRVIDYTVTFDAMHAKSDFGNRSLQQYNWNAKFYVPVKEGNIGSTIYAAPEGIWCNT